jgi:hypothetical protein
MLAMGNTAIAMGLESVSSAVGISNQSILARRLTRRRIKGRQAGYGQPRGSPAE